MQKLHRLLVRTRVIQRVAAALPDAQTIAEVHVLDVGELADLGAGIVAGIVAGQHVHRVAGTDV